MAGLSATQLLEAWERGRAGRPSLWGVVLLAAAEPGRSMEAIAALPLGHRDAQLIHLRRRTFGERAEAFVACPSCEAPLEFNVPLAELAAGAPPEVPATVSVDGATLRVPTTADVVAVEGRPDAGEALLARLLVDGSPPEPEAATAALAEADPLAELRFDLACADCGHAWSTIFDISAFFWREVEVDARRLMEEVGHLARTFGWSERDILAMSPSRRRAYLDMAVDR